MKRIYTYLTEDNFAQYVIHRAFDVIIFCLLFLGVLASILETIDLSQSIMMKHPQATDMLFDSISTIAILGMFTLIQAYLIVKDRWSEKFLR